MDPRADIEQRLRGLYAARDRNLLVASEASAEARMYQQKIEEYEDVVKVLQIHYESV